MIRTHFEYPLGVVGLDLYGIPRTRILTRVADRSRHDSYVPTRISNDYV